MQERLGQPVVVENRPGAGGNTGTEAVARAEPDGYSTVVAANFVVMTPLFAQQPGYTLADLAPLGRAATQPVVYRGDPRAPLMVIGEGPGTDEDIQGQPFVGRAGKLLDRMLGAAGVSDRVLITNTVFWRPPGNRTPTPAEQAICAPFLERIIALVQPRMLLMVGAASAKSLLKQEDGILKLRGRWFDWRSADGTLELPSLPTLHPAFLLRQPGAKKNAWKDLLTLTERLDRPDRPL